MNFANLSSVVFGDKEAMKDFLFENSLQHTLFRDTITAAGGNPPGYPITDVDFDNFDDWLLYHQNEHQYFAAVLDLNNPFNMLDADFRKDVCGCSECRQRTHDQQQQGHHDKRIRALKRQTYNIERHR